MRENGKLQVDEAGPETLLKAQIAVSEVLGRQCLTHQYLVQLRAKGSHFQNRRKTDLVARTV